MWSGRRRLVSCETVHFRLSTSDPRPPASGKRLPDALPLGEHDADPLLVELGHPLLESHANQVDLDGDVIDRFRGRIQFTNSLPAVNLVTGKTEVERPHDTFTDRTV